MITSPIYQKTLSINYQGLSDGKWIPVKNINWDEMSALCQGENWIGWFRCKFEDFKVVDYFDEKINKWVTINTDKTLSFENRACIGDTMVGLFKTRKEAIEFIIKRLEKEHEC